MRNDDNAILITATLLKSDMPTELVDVEARARWAMAAVKDEANGWCLDGSEDQQFRAACAALLMVSDEATRKRIDKELRILKTLSAAMSGVPVDFGALVDDDDDLAPIGLMGIWKQLKAAS